MKERWRRIKARLRNWWERFLLRRAYAAALLDEVFS